MKKIEKSRLNHHGKNFIDTKLQNTLRDGTCGCLCAGCSCLIWRGVVTISPMQVVILG